jgi:hypothetical protein
VPEAEVIHKPKQPPKRPLLVFSGNSAYAAFLRLATPTNPSKPDPNNQMAGGIGTGEFLTRYKPCLSRKSVDTLFSTPREKDVVVHVSLV